MQGKGHNIGRVAKQCLTCSIEISYYKRKNKTWCAAAGATESWSE